MRVWLMIVFLVSGCGCGRGSEVQDDGGYMWLGKGACDGDGL